MQNLPVAAKIPRMSRSDRAAELALKAYTVAFDRDFLSEMPQGEETMRQIADTVDLTEAPEDAVCSLVIDLMRYCERKKIDWAEDVMERAWKRVRGRVL